MDRLRLIGGGPSSDKRARQGARSREARRLGRRGRQFRSDRPDHPACVVESAYTVGLNPTAGRIKGSNPFTGTKNRIGVTAARLTLTQEVVVRIHGPVPYRAGVMAARSALTRSEGVQSLCPVPYGSVAKRSRRRTADPVSPVRIGPEPPYADVLKRLKRALPKSDRQETARRFESCHRRHIRL